MSLISKQLRAFMAVAESDSISHASVKLSLTVSPVSKMISDFEAYYKQRFFIRRGNGIELTQQGKNLHLSLSPLYHQLKQIEDDMKKVYRMNKKLNMYHDWGKDWIIYSVINELELRKINRTISIENIGSVTNKSPTGDESIYFLSREFFLNGYSLLDRFPGPQLKFVSSIKHHFSAVKSVLLVSEEQLLNPIINRLISRLKMVKEIDHVRVFNSCNIIKQLISDGKGIGLLPDTYQGLSGWNGFIFSNVVGDEVNDYHTYVYAPSGLERNGELEEVLNAALKKEISNTRFSSSELCRQ